MALVAFLAGPCYKFTSCWPTSCGSTWSHTHASPCCTKPKVTASCNACSGRGPV